MGNWSRWTRGTSRSSRLANLLAPFSLFRSRHSTRRNAQSRAVTGMGPYSFFLCVCLKCWCGGVSASSHRGGRLLLLLSGPDSLSLFPFDFLLLSLSLSVFPIFHETAFSSSSTPIRLSRTDDATLRSKPCRPHRVFFNCVDRGGGSSFLCSTRLPSPPAHRII